MSEKGLTNISLKKINKSKVYQYIYKSKVTSKLQIVSDLQMGLSTVSQNLNLLEQEGLIYPVKGTGNFIADSEEVRKLSKASYIKELKTLIRKGKAMGMEAEELIYIIRECYKEEKP